MGAPSIVLLKSTSDINYIRRLESRSYRFTRAEKFPPIRLCPGCRCCVGNILRTNLLKTPPWGSPRRCGRPHTVRRGKQCHGSTHTVAVSRRKTRNQISTVNRVPYLFRPRKQNEIFRTRFPASESARPDQGTGWEGGGEEIGMTGSGGRAGGMGWPENSGSFRDSGDNARTYATGERQTRRGAGRSGNGISVDYGPLNVFGRLTAARPCSKSEINRFVNNDGPGIDRRTR